jgi:hypothetical protein
MMNPLIQQNERIYCIHAVQNLSIEVKIPPVRSFLLSEETYFQVMPSPPVKMNCVFKLHSTVAILHPMIVDYKQDTLSQKIHGLRKMTSEKIMWI